MTNLYDDEIEYCNHYACVWCAKLWIDVTFDKTSFESQILEVYGYYTTALPHNYQHPTNIAMELCKIPDLCKYSVVIRESA